MGDESEAPAGTAPTSSTPSASQTPAPVTVRYVGALERTYYYPGAPITVQPGDVIALPPGVRYDPHDAAWQLAPGAAVTRMADNDPANPNQPKQPDPEFVAHSLTERAEIFERLGLDEAKGE